MDKHDLGAETAYFRSILLARPPRDMTSIREIVEHGPFDRLSDSDRDAIIRELSYSFGFSPVEEELAP